MSYKNNFNIELSSADVIRYLRISFMRTSASRICVNEMQPFPLELMVDHCYCRILGVKRRRGAGQFSVVSSKETSPEQVSVVQSSAEQSLSTEQMSLG